MNLLKIIDNPINDIALVTVLRSMIGGFTDNELIKIRLESSQKGFYEAMCEYKEKEDADKELAEKIKNFQSKIEEFRKCQEYMPLNEFIWKIYQDTGYYSYVSLLPNGILRAANLKILFEKAKQFEQTSFKGLYNFISFIQKLSISNKDMSGAKLIGENENVIRIMSIHKSKGLEFPIVFLSGTNKQFYITDINNNSVLLDQDLGIGPKYINYNEGKTYSTLAREAVKYKAKKDLISEEMRILYVALTRAKEKLIITGLEKDYKTSIEAKEKLLKTYGDETKINTNIIQNYLSYLDWIELVSLKSEKEIIKVKVYQKNKLLKEMLKEEKEEEMDLAKELEKVKEIKNPEIQNKIQWEYKYKKINNILTKSSVTQIKNMKLDLEEEENHEYNIPEYLKEKRELTAGQKGTLMHLILQNLNEKVEYDMKNIEELLSSLKEKGTITEQEEKAVNKEQILAFTKTNMWKQMKDAKKVKKESPFYIYIPAKEIYNEDLEEEILVQGIIDLYYITKDEELILVDYKTDKVKEEAELIEKYKIQLDIYKKALERALKRKVDSVYIYSTNLGKEIKIY